MSPAHLRKEKEVTVTMLIFMFQGAIGEKDKRRGKERVTLFYPHLQISEQKRRKLFVY